MRVRYHHPKSESSNQRAGVFGLVWVCDCVCGLLRYQAPIASWL
jgi:hypothetical protein